MPSTETMWSLVSADLDKLELAILCADQYVDDTATCIQGPEAVRYDSRVAREQLEAQQVAEWQTQNG